MPSPSIELQYVARHPSSQRLAERARAVCPGGVSQISRDFQPFPIYYQRASGTRKWTVDGHETVDFVMGHGALIFGHEDPEIASAVNAQLACGTHYTGPSEPEITLAELICEMVPSAERVRFVGTGSEACDLALRVARAATGRDVYVKFEGHYHGWHDQELVALRPPYDVALSAGLPRSVGDGRVVLPPNDLAALELYRSANATWRASSSASFRAGGGHGTVPTSPAWVAGVRELTRRRNVILIFDEMVTGFRLAPGGYQGRTGIVPDLTTLGKTLFAGFPGAALVGRADLMDRAEAPARRHSSLHYGSWNAFPVACAAGAAGLRRLRDGRVQDQINAYGARLRAAFNEVLVRRSAAARVYGSGSHVHFCLRPWPFGADDEIPIGRHAELANDPRRVRLLRLALYNEGLDFDFANNISSVHGDAELERAVTGFDRAVSNMLEERLL